MKARLKVLVSAYACSPYQGSEPGVGWGFVAELAKHHDLWVIVEEEKFRADIERYLADKPAFSQNVKFHFIQKQRNRLLRKLWPPSYYRYYRQWHQDALVLAKKLHAEVSFDLAHQLTMVGFREPGYLWQLGVPFVWGPIGGMGLFPWRFLPKLGVYGALYYTGYNLYNWMQMRFMQRPRVAAQVAGSGLLAATPNDQAAALAYWGKRSTVITEVGLPNPPLETLQQRIPGAPLRIIWTGLHIPRKALNLGLEALGRLPADMPWELHILGKGPRTASWKQLAAQLGIADKCHFHGWIPRDKALETMATSHVMLITSLRDLTSTVTIEALALGLPIVCLDHCGFAHVVDDTCGVKVALTAPNEVIEGLAAALARLARDESLRQQLAHGALARSKAFAWDKKIEVLNRIYESKLLEATPALEHYQL
jgi:glycosyltransferase involved in cell wall biosynthesis